MQATLLLCDWAETNPEGKLYAMGIGWKRIASDQPTFTAVALLLSVPYDQTNTKHNVTIKLMTEDGQPFPADTPAAFGFQFEIGRPPGMRRGEDQTVPFAAKINGLILPENGYRWEVIVDDVLLSSESFRAVRQPPGPGG
jgi:hypothetical protein